MKASHYSLSDRNLQFTCKCIACGKRFELTERQIIEAEEVGCAISPCCNFPSTVERVKVKS